MLIENLNLNYDLIDNGDSRKFKIYWKLGDTLPDGTVLTLSNKQGWIINRKGRGARILDQLSIDPIWVPHNRFRGYLKRVYDINRIDYYCIINHGSINLRRKCCVNGCDNECSEMKGYPSIVYNTCCNEHLKSVHSRTFSAMNHINWNREEYRKYHREIKQTKVNRSVFINKFGPDSKAMIYITQGIDKINGKIYNKFGITHYINGGREKGLRTYYKLTVPLKELFIGTSEEVAWIESIVKYIVFTELKDTGYPKGSESIQNDYCSLDKLESLVNKSIEIFKLEGLDKIKELY